MSQANINAMHGVLQVLSSGNYDQLGEFIAQDAVSHEIPPDYGPGLEGFKKYFMDFIFTIFTSFIFFYLK